MQIKYYYINLDRSEQRKAFMQKQFKLLAINPVRISAIDGYKFSHESIKKISHKQNFKTHFMSPTNGEVGAFLSHKDCWKIISEQNEEFAVVIEDDVYINADLLIDIEEIIKVITTDDIVDISGRKGFILLEQKTSAGNIKLLRFSTPPLGMTGKIIGKNAAIKINKFSPDYLAPVDVMLQKKYQHKVPIWSTSKNYVSHADKNVGGTTIQLRKASLFAKILRELKRPFWRLANKSANFISDYR